MIDPNDFNPEYASRITVPDDPRIRYKYRARTTGLKEWTCLYCGHLNETRIRPQTWTLRCDQENCRRTIGFGDVAYVLPSGPRVAPPDIVIPRGLIEVFPEGDISRWASGQPIHRVHLIQWPEESKS